MQSTRPPTGAQFLASLRDGREVWVHGERVPDVTTHPAFRNSAGQLARLYDALHDPANAGTLVGPTDTGGDGYTHRFFPAPYTVDDLRAGVEAITVWARMTYGWMGRTPDFKASFLSTLGSYPDLYAPYQDNARRWYRTAQERLPNVGHALANPPVDRNLGAAAVRGVHVSVQKETDAGLVVSGAKVVATGAVLTNYTFIGSFAPIPAGAKEFAAAFLVRTDAPGVKLLCRPSYEYAAARAGSPFYYPLSSRFDENDAIVVFDDVLVPWEDVLCYDVDQANRFPHDSGFLHRGLLHGCVRLAVKFDFLCGLLLKGVELTGAGEARGVQTRVGELLSYRNLFWSCVHAMVERAVPWPDGTVVPNPEACAAYRLMATTLYPRARQIFLQDLSSSMVYTGSDPAEWHAPDVRPYFDRYLRGTGDRDAEQRVKLMRLIWDAIGSEFGGRHELYELNYAGNHEVVRLENLRWARESGQTRRYEEFVERCMSEYDTTGWTQPF